MILNHPEVIQYHWNDTDLTVIVIYLCHKASLLWTTLYSWLNKPICTDYASKMCFHVILVTQVWACLKVVCFVIVLGFGFVTISFPPVGARMYSSVFSFGPLRFDWTLFSFLLPPHHSFLWLSETDDSTGLQMIHNAHTRGLGVVKASMNLWALTVPLALVNSNPPKRYTLRTQPPPSLALINVTAWDIADYFTLSSSAGAGGSCGWIRLMFWHTAAGE